MRTNQEQNRQKAVTARELALLAALLLFAAAVFLAWRLFAPAGAAVIVEQEGKVIFEADFSALADPQVLETGGTKIEITREGARFLSADCPDKLCVKSGLLNRAGESAVCLPNRVSVRITGNGAADAATG